MAPRNPMLTMAAIVTITIVSLLAVLAYVAATTTVSTSEPIPTTDHGTDNTTGTRP